MPQKWLNGASVSYAAVSTDVMHIIRTTEPQLSVCNGTSTITNQITQPASGNSVCRVQAWLQYITFLQIRLPRMWTEAMLHLSHPHLQLKGSIRLTQYIFRDTVLLSAVHVGIYMVGHKHKGRIQYEAEIICDQYHKTVEKL